MNETRTLSSYGAPASMPSGNAVLSVNYYGAVTEVQPEAVVKAASGGAGAQCMFSGVFIVYHRKSDGYPVFARPEAWEALQNKGETATGVAIAEGGRVLIVAPTEARSSSARWSSAAIRGGGVRTSDVEVALADFSGRASTAAIIAASTPTAITNTATYAPGACHMYSRINGQGYGFAAGAWWLPSLGEAMMIFSRLEVVNFCLGIIDGGVPIAASSHWLCTESSDKEAWAFDFSNGYIGRYPPKSASYNRVRAVTAFALN